MTGEQEVWRSIKLGDVIPLEYYRGIVPKALCLGLGEDSGQRMVFEHEGDYLGEPILNRVWIPPRGIIRREGVYTVNSFYSNNTSCSNLFPGGNSLDFHGIDFVETLARLIAHRAITDRRLLDLAEDFASRLTFFDYQSYYFKDTLRKAREEMTARINRMGTEVIECEISIN